MVSSAIEKLIVYVMTGVAALCLVLAWIITAPLFQGWVLLRCSGQRRQSQRRSNSNYRRIAAPAHSLHAADLDLPRKSAGTW